MLTALLALSLLLPQLDDSFPSFGTESEVELVSIVGTTRLTLVNPSATPALVRLATLDGFQLTTLAVPARGERILEFPRRTLAGTTLALIAASPEGRISSGALSIDHLIEAGYRAVWFESVGSTIHAWGELPTGPGYITPEPGTYNTSLPTPPVSPGPHVPVVSPANKPRGDLPPRIEPVPPPPV